MTQKFTTYSASLGGEVDDWQPPAIFRRLFMNKKEFTNLFLMDGETAREMNRDVGAKIVHESIRQVTNLSNVHLLISTTGRKGQIDEYIDTQLSQFLGAGGAKNESLKSALEVTKEQIKKRSEQLRKAEKDVDMYELGLQKIQDRLDELDENIDTHKKQLNDAKARLITANGNLTKNTINILKELHNPSFSFPNWEKIQKFHASQNKAKLPRSVGSSWFEEILELDRCICGLKWDKDGDMKTHISTHKDDFLDTNLMTFVKEMQNKVVDSNSNLTIGEKVTLLENSQITQLEAKQDVDDIRGQASEEDRKKFEEYGVQKGLLLGQLEDARDVKEDLGTESKEIIREKKLDKNMYTSDNSITVSPAKIRQIKNITCLKDIEINIKDKLGVGEYAKSMQRGADLCHDIIKTMLRDIEKEIRIELESKMNDSLNSMVGAGTSGGLTVKISNAGLDYYNPNGDLQSNVNMAAELGGAYAFVSALNNYAEVSIPLVLDTPFAGFGKGMAANWTKLVPETFDQVIALINSLEMVGLYSWFENNEDVETYLIRRKDENIRTGLPQEGKMILDMDLNNFVNYEIDAGGSE